MQELVRHLQVSMHDAHIVQVVNSVQDLTDQRARILLRVKSFFYDSVKQLAAGYPAEWQRVCASVCVC